MQSEVGFYLRRQRGKVRLGKRRGQERRGSSLAKSQIGVLNRILQDPEVLPENPERHRRLNRPFGVSTPHPSHFPPPTDSVPGGQLFFANGFKRRACKTGGGTKS